MGLAPCGHLENSIAGLALPLVGMSPGKSGRLPGSLKTFGFTATSDAHENMSKTRAAEVGKPFGQAGNLHSLHGAFLKKSTIRPRSRIVRVEKRRAAAVAQPFVAVSEDVRSPSCSRRPNEPSAMHFSESRASAVHRLNHF
jgi:hypothetical protein